MKTYTVHASRIVYSCTVVQAASPEDSERIDLAEDGLTWEEYDGDHFNIIEVELEEAA